MNTSTKKKKWNTPESYESNNVITKEDWSDRLNGDMSSLVSSPVRAGAFGGDAIQWLSGLIKQTTEDA